MEDLGKIIVSEKKALKLGVAIENKSIEYYTLCLKNVPRKAAGVEIAKIIEEEKLHKLKLENLLQGKV